MLFDFHRLENAKKPKSVHATYVVVGTPNEGELQPTNGMHSTDADGDQSMPSSSFLPSSQVEDPVPITSIMLVREEDLAGRFYFLNLNLSVASVIWPSKLLA
jgi:DNA polymerase delta subunit 3